MADIRSSVDPAEWSAEFLRRHPGGASPENLESWFANAIEAGRSKGFSDADGLDVEITRPGAEAKLRSVLSWARREAATNRNTDPVAGRAAALVATHTEDALRVLILPVP